MKKSAFDVLAVSATFVAFVAVVAVPTVIPAGSDHCGALPVEVMMYVFEPIPSLESEVPVV
jgi:hypothetical protein